MTPRIPTGRSATAFSGQQATRLRRFTSRWGRRDISPLMTPSCFASLARSLKGHPNCLKLPGVEVSSGSLGQGLGVAVGNALAGRLAGQSLSRLLHHG
jgi:transketolase